MLLRLQKDTNLEQAYALVERLSQMGFRVVVQEEEGIYQLAVVSGVDAKTRPQLFTALPLVEEVLPLTARYQLAARQPGKERSTITIGDVKIGNGHFVVMSGSCSVESEEQIFATAERVSKVGAKILRGGAFKPRTSPYDFQGLGLDGLKYMRAAADEYNMLAVTEVMDAEDMPMVAEYVDILQIGARNMHNFSLLKKAGQQRKPVLLKRGFAATYQEFLLAAEYILSEGNPNVLLCERGIRTFETYTRNTLDVTAVPALQQLTHLPVIVDPSHGTGLRELVAPMSLASVAAGCDGLIIESHPTPDKALSDARQTISCEALGELMAKIKSLGPVFGFEL